MRRYFFCLRFVCNFPGNQCTSRKRARPKLCFCVSTLALAGTPPPTARRTAYKIWHHLWRARRGPVQCGQSGLVSSSFPILLDCGNMCKQSKCISIFSSWYFSLGSMTSTSSSTPVIANWRRHRESRQRSHAVDWFMFVLAKGGSN